MKGKMKKMVKRMAMIVIAAAIIFTSTATPIRAEAKGTAFIKKKLASVTPTIRSAKRSKGKLTVTVTIPTPKYGGTVKKYINGEWVDVIAPRPELYQLNKTERITVKFGTTKHKKKFQGGINTVEAKRIGKNKYRFTITDKCIINLKNLYISVRFESKEFYAPESDSDNLFASKSNWSKLVKVSGKVTSAKNYKMPKRDKDGTYTKAICKRFRRGYARKDGWYSIDSDTGFIQGAYIPVLSEDRILVSVWYRECAVCGHRDFTFTESAEKKDNYLNNHSCLGNTKNAFANIYFSRKTGKVVMGDPRVLDVYPVGTFFMDVD